MTVISSRTDAEDLSLTFIAEFSAAPDRVWEVWADPRQLERWWGPPTWPATFERHDFTVGGESRYYMTGPDGEPDPAMPVIHGAVTLDPVGGGTRMTTRSTFASAEQLAQVLEMGMEEGMREAMGQINAVLADG